MSTLPLARTAFTVTEARALTSAVEEFVNAHVELDRTIWRDRMRVHAQKWEQEWRQRNHETA